MARTLIILISPIKREKRLCIGSVRNRIGEKRMSRRQLDPGKRIYSSDVIGRGDMENIGRGVFIDRR